MIAKSNVSSAAAKDDLLPADEIDFEEDSYDAKPLAEDYYFEDDHKAAPFDDLVFDFEIEDDYEYFDEFEMDEFDDEPLNNYSPVEGLNLAQASRASSTYHSGPEYPFIRHKRSRGSRTYDNSRGGWTVSCTDTANGKHKVSFN